MCATGRECLCGCTVLASSYSNCGVKTVMLWIAPAPAPMRRSITHAAPFALQMALGTGLRAGGSWRTGISKGKMQTAHRSRQLVAKVGIRRSPQPGGAVWAVLFKVLLKAQDGAGV